jgi:hypothetical protein
MVSTISRQVIEEAMSKAQRDVQDQARMRSKNIMGNTVSNLVEDLLTTPLGGPTRDLLLLLKTTQLLEMLKEQWILKQDEVDELNAYLLQLYTAYTEKPAAE